MSEEQIQQLLDDLRMCAAPLCLCCLHSAPEATSRCEEIDYACEECPDPCPCKTCGEANGHAGWKWRGLRKDEVNA